VYDHGMAMRAQSPGGGAGGTRWEIAVRAPDRRLGPYVRDRHLKAGGRGTWTELALEFGYYDQAHLGLDVRRFTGLTPTQVRATLIDFKALPAAEVNFLQDPPRAQP
jgi:AraC-like DNA-binding protein